VVMYGVSVEEWRWEEIIVLGSKGAK